MTARRDLLVALCAAAFAPQMAFGQSKPPVLIGWLHFGSRESGARFFSAFGEGLAALGWKTGSQVVIEQRWAEGRLERLQPLAGELAAKTPAVIVAAPGQAVAAAAKAAPKTPVVQANVQGNAGRLCRGGSFRAVHRRRLLAALQPIACGTSAGRRAR